MELTHPGPCGVLGPGRCKRFSAYVEEVSLCVRACVRACVNGCLRACVRACMCVCVRTCVFAIRACLICLGVFLSQGVFKTLNVAEGLDDPAGDDKPELSLVEKMMADLRELL